MRRLPTLVVTVALAVALVGPVAPAADTGVPERLGEVAGVAYDDSISVTLSDGLDEAELDALVARSMARLEVVRERSFAEMVAVELVSREGYREDAGPSYNATERRQANARWEALFVVGEDRDATAVLDEAFAGGVQGFYSPDEERIVVVSEATDGATVDKETLVHELVHALQDQQFGLDSDAGTADARVARDSVVEGEAELVTARYLDRCGVAWSCLTPEDTSDGTDVALGIRLWLLAPYSEGAEFVERVEERGDWAAVDALHEDPPESSAQVIHPERYPDDVPADVSVPDRSSEAWSRLGGSGGDTLGESAVYAMLVHNDIADVGDPLGYEHPFSAGWAGGRFVPYERDDGVSGYVWETVWESAAEAEEFAFAYRQLLDSHDAVETGDGVHVVPDGPFADAFRVTREDRTVRVVNAPTADALSAVHGR